MRSKDGGGQAPGDSCQEKDLIVCLESQERSAHAAQIDERKGGVGGVDRRRKSMGGKNGKRPVCPRSYSKRNRKDCDNALRVGRKVRGSKKRGANTAVNSRLQKRRRQKNMQGKEGGGAQQKGTLDREQQALYV